MTGHKGGSGATHHGGKGGKWATWKVVLLVVLICLGGTYVMWGLFTGDWLLWWQPTTPAPTSSQLTFSFIARDTGDELAGASLEVYGNNSDGLTDVQADARTGDNFIDLGANVSGEGFTPELHWDYVGVLTCPNYCVQEFIIDTTLVGTYTIYMDPVGTNASIAALSSTLKANLLDDNDNTTANTTETDWTLFVQPLDDGGLANDSLAFTPYCSFMEGGVAFSDFATYTNWFLIDLTLNCTADPTWVTVNSPDATVDNSTTHLFILLNEKVLGRTPIEISFDDGIGTDFTIESGITAFGTESSYIPLGVMA